MTPAPDTDGPDLPQVRRLVTEVPGPRSRELAARRAALVARGVGRLLPVYLDRAGGGVLVDVDGNSLIDFSSGIAVTNVGNAAERVVSAVREQVGRLTHSCFSVAPHPGYLAVCEALHRLTPGAHEKRSALFNTGAEAVENAVKIARSHTRRQAVVAFDHGFHGRSYLTMTLTAKNMPYKDGFGPFVPEVHRVPASYPFREPAPIDGPRAAARAIDVIARQIGAHNVACVLIEPIQGEGGFVVPAPGFLPVLAEWCAEQGIVFVADEIQTGFARTGDMFACTHERVVPDLIITAKALGGGLPLAAVTGRAEIMNAPHVGGLGGTYAGNPVACAAALGAITTIEEQDLVGAARGIGATMLPRLRALADAHPVIGDVRGRGAMLAVELVDPDTREPDPATTAAVARACHSHGLFVLTAGTFDNVLRFLPPLVIPDALLDEGLDVLEAAVASVATGSPGAATRVPDRVLVTPD